MMGRKTLREVRATLETARIDHAKLSGPGGGEVVASLHRFLNAGEPPGQRRAKKPRRAAGKLAKRA